MRYLALLRGINVGGNNIIRMEALRASFASGGFTNVSTFIQSGNVIFESAETDTGNLTETVERILSHDFSYGARAVILSMKQMEHVVDGVPHEWDIRTDIRRYLAFVREPAIPTDIAPRVPLHPDVDSLLVGPGALYMTTLASGLTKSGFTKLIGMDIYKNLTIRNYTTVRKILELMRGGPKT